MHKQSQEQIYRTSRRQLLMGAAAASALALTLAVGAADSDGSGGLPQAFAGLKPLGGRVRPITADEFRERLQHAQKLMSDLAPSYDALFLAPGTSLYYFTGIRWGISERLLALVLPRTGKPILVVPGFEEGRLREKLQFPAEVRVWQEDESPTKIAAAALGDRGIRTGRVGVEETAPFMFFDHLRGAAPGFECVSPDAVTIACRRRKSAQELQLMRLACEATCNVFRAVFASPTDAMSQADIRNLADGGFSTTGLPLES